MADITDPEAIRFTNEQIRVLCEKARALVTEIGSLQTSWFGGLSAEFPNSANDMVQDGREAEGVSRLTGADVNSAVNILLAMKTASNAEILQKPCVSPLKVI